MDNDERIEVSPLLGERGEMSALETVRIPVLETGTNAAIVSGVDRRHSFSSALYLVSKRQFFHCFTIEGQFPFLDLFHGITPSPLLVNPLLVVSNLDCWIARGFALIFL